MLAALALLVSVLMRAVMGVLARLLSAELSVLQQVSLRCLLGALLILLICHGRLRLAAFWHLPRTAQWLLVQRAVALFVVGMSLGTEAFIQGNYTTTTLVLALPTTALVSRWYFGERLSTRVMMLVALSFVGVLVFVAGNGQTLLLGWPFWCALAAAVAMSWGMLAARKTGVTLPADAENAMPPPALSNLEATFWMLLIAALVCGVLALPVAWWEGKMPRPGLATWLTAAVAGLASIAFVWTSDYAIPRLRGVVVNNILALQPIAGAMIGWLLYGDVLTPLQWLGGGLVVLSVWLIARVRAG